MTITIRSNADGSSDILNGAVIAAHIATDGKVSFPTLMPLVATDPIIERGSNANGQWTKFADGTLLMGLYQGSVNAANPNTRINWPFPVAAIGSVFPSVVFVSPNSRTIRTTLESVSLTVASGFIFNSGSAQVGALYWQAWGRWK